MIRISIAAILLSAFSLPALADTTLSVGIKEYSDFFKRCDLAITAEGGGVASTSVIYRALVEGKGAEICQVEPYSSGCRDADDLEYTCEDPMKVDVYDVECRDQDGAPMACGKVSVVAKDGLDVSALPDLGGSGTRLAATLLGVDDFFERCEIGFSYAAAPEITQVEVAYQIAHPGGEHECTTNLSGSGGTGLSCSGSAKYTCEDISKVNIMSVSCETENGPAECGDVTLRAVEDGLFIDAR